MERVQIQWDDNYIFEYWEECRNWLTLLNQYNETHNTSIRYNTFKSHCYRIGLNFHYSDEQIRWLTENYPTLGKHETARLFNEVFETNRSTGEIFIKCKKLGLRVTEERRKQRAINNTGRYVPIGRCVTKQHGEKYIKTESGFKRVKDMVYGDVPRGMSLVYLDGNKDNIQKDNLYPVSRAVLARMTANGFWSDNGTITKTGIMCCELEEMLRKERVAYGRGNWVRNPKNK